MVIRSPTTPNTVVHERASRAQTGKGGKGDLDEIQGISDRPASRPRGSVAATAATPAGDVRPS
jgi:hypothetical protein